MLIAGMGKLAGFLLEIEINFLKKRKILISKRKPASFPMPAINIGKRGLKSICDLLRRVRILKQAVIRRNT
jgi:hypothetical protein